MRAPTLMITLAAALAATTLPLRARQTQLHVELRGDDGDEVEISLPLSAIGSTPFIPARIRSRSRIEIDGDRISIEDLRRAWNEMRRDGDTTYLKITEDDSRIRFFKRGSDLRITIDEDDGDRVELRLPSRAVDALLSGEDDELEVAAALRVMAEIGHGELVAISDGNERVRVWVGDGD